MAAANVKGSEKVYALHDFDAENPDEVSFKAGEEITVVEKDDAYGDGWWQGTNPRGETGLFPFSYTTYDRDAAAGLVGGAGHPAGTTDDASREANGKGVKATMDDIDIALARMQAGQSVGADDASERTGDLSVGETDEGGDAEDEYETRSKARAALAVNAAKKNEDADQTEREEQARLKAQAMRVFEEEEEKHRQLLLQKEEERKAAAAKGALPVDEKPKEAPIAGVEMSDDSDSEGSDEAHDFDDTAPTHAPLFGPGVTAAAIGATAIGAGAGLKPQQARPLSPIASDDAHARALAANGTQNKTSTGLNGQQSIRSTDEILEDRSVDSSRISGSPAHGKSYNSVTAPTSVLGSETPRSTKAVPVALSPSPSMAGSRGGGPGGDPHEWTVEQVVEWGRSKGWDEASVVSKFAEHEISGDVLMEMDANILKEIEITAFGKRFQVANAIKDLKKSVQSGGTSSAEPTQAQWSAPIDSASTSLQQQQARSVSQAYYERPASSSDVPATTPSGLGAPINGVAVGGAGVNGQRNVSNATAPPEVNHAPFHAIQPEPNESNAETGSIINNEQTAGLPGDDSFRQSSSQWGKSSFSPDTSMNYSNFNQQHASSPRKRESTSSSTKSPTDRSSFFANLSGQRNRKPAPRVQSGGAAATGGETETSSNSKGTLSRLGFNRLKGSQSSESSSAAAQELRNKISLPTGSPTFDAMGDTARRHRLSNLGPSPTSNIPPGFGGHQRQASVGSGGPGAADWHTPNEPRSPGGSAPEGAVMVRIRPVDFEGWMRKKGERYNSWKPRYLALKGSDLVLLRDPTAAKIKGYVNMKGYKVIADENTNPGKYGFKILHETEKPHYFSSDDAIAVREWMKALMKATIGRDTSLPVISSYNNATISLKEAQRMNPPPRPPSPTSRARAQRAAARANKDQLTAKDASVLMGLQSPRERQLGFIQPNSPLTPNPPSSSVEFEELRCLERKSSARRVKPLELGKQSRPSYLPEVDRADGDVQSDKHECDLLDADITPRLESKALEAFDECAGPTPPSKPFASVVPLSSSMGLAELPAPPPPTHSAGHQERIQALLQQCFAQIHPSTSAVPSPISKDFDARSIASSVSSYPTVSSAALEVIGSAPLPGRHGDRTSVFAPPSSVKPLARETDAKRSLAGELITSRMSLAGFVTSPEEEEQQAGSPGLSSSVLQSSGSRLSRAWKSSGVRRPRTASEHTRTSVKRNGKGCEREGSFIVFSVQRQTNIRPLTASADVNARSTSEFDHDRTSLSDGKTGQMRQASPEDVGHFPRRQIGIVKQGDSKKKQGEKDYDEQTSASGRRTGRAQEMRLNHVRRHSSIDLMGSGSGGKNDDDDDEKKDGPKTTLQKMYAAVTSPSVVSLSHTIRTSAQHEGGSAPSEACTSPSQYDDGGPASSASSSKRQGKEQSATSDNSVLAGRRKSAMRQLGFKSWVKWKGEREKMRESEVAMEELMAQAEKELLWDKEVEWQSSMKQKRTSVGKQKASMAKWTLRQDSIEYFGRMRKQANAKQRGVSNDASSSNKLFDGHDPDPHSAPSFCPEGRRGSDFMEEMAANYGHPGVIHSPTSEDGHRAPRIPSLPPPPTPGKGR